MRNRLFRLCLVLLAGVKTAWCAGEGGGGGVDVVVDFLERFRPGLVRDSSDTMVRRPARCGGVGQDALFEHPQGGGRPARVEYEFELPRLDEGDRLFFAFEIGIADGAKFGTGADGVRFAVELNGERHFARDWRACQWEAHGLDLRKYRGQRVRLGLLTEAIGNTSYDWAVWGNPRILHFKGAGREVMAVIGRGKVQVPVRGGVLAVPKGRQEVKMRLQGEGGFEWVVPSSAVGGVGWVAKDFRMKTAGVLSWEPAEAVLVEEILAADYAAQVSVRRVGPGRALVYAGETVPVMIELENKGRGALRQNEAKLELTAGGRVLGEKAVAELGPGEVRWEHWAWEVGAKSGAIELGAKVTGKAGDSKAEARVEVLPSATESDVTAVENGAMKIEFVKSGGGYSYARIWGRGGDRWEQVAVWKPLVRIVSTVKGGEREWEARPARIKIARSDAGTTAEARATVRDGDGAGWTVRLAVTMERNGGVARVIYGWQSERDREVRALWGPNIYVGEGTTAAGKSWGLFPGLEFLYGAERSSNVRDLAPSLADRRTPDPRKITIPLMAVTIGPQSQEMVWETSRFFAPDSWKDRGVRGSLASSSLQSEFTVGLIWDPDQRWDGERFWPSARFSSPNMDEGMANHRLGLFLPSVPEHVEENSDRARRPYVIGAGKELVLESELVVERGAAGRVVARYLRGQGGLPEPNRWPRTWQEELDICRAGFLKTVWDETSQKWRHCIGWGASHAPGFATLLWWDSNLADGGEERRASAERVELAGGNILREGGPGLLMSQANCHIMQWEFPFYYGYLPEAMRGLEGQVRQMIGTQASDGGWRYAPGDTQQADLGQAGDAVLGTGASRAAFLMRYARVTGDEEALAAGERALGFLETFRVPRGGQTWECPMYEPDILAAAYAIRAYHDGYRLTGNPRWLHNAVYWAETGVPFVYLWGMRDKPMMLGATIPVFGSTFYTHTWLAVPVQWCGLVYSYHVWHLADELAMHTVGKNDSPLPLALGFTARDWKRLVELITVSSLYQQFDGGEKIGTYPDSISRFEQRNPAFINPEDILMNVLAMRGHDPDIQTAVIGAGLSAETKRVVVSSGARIKQATVVEGNALEFVLELFPGTTSYSLVHGWRPKAVFVNGEMLMESLGRLGREPGWFFEERTGRIYLAIRHAGGEVRVRVER